MQHVEYGIYACDNLGNWEKTELYLLNLNSYPTTTADTPFPFIGVLVSMMVVF